MLEPLFFFMTVFIAFIEVLKPLYGVCYLIFTFLIMPYTYFDLKGLQAWRPNLVLSVILFVSTVFRNSPVRTNQHTVLVVMFLGLAYLSALINGVLGITEVKSVLFVFVKNSLFVIIIASCINNRKDLLLLIKTCVFFSMCNGAYALLIQVFQIKSMLTDKGRPSAFQGDPNYLAALLIAIIPIAYYLFLHGEKKFLRRFYVVTIGLLITGTLCTVSRGGLLGLVLVMGCIFLKNIKKISTIIVVIIVLTFFVNVAQQLFEERQTVQTSLSGKTTVEASAYSRLVFAGYAFRLWLRNPIWGVGTTQFPDASNKQLGTRIHHTVHNAYLTILSEHGILGFAVFMGFFILALGAIRRLKKQEEVFFRELAWYLQISLMGYMLCACFISIQRQVMLWICLVLPIILDKILKIENIAKQK